MIKHLKRILRFLWPKKKAVIDWEMLKKAPMLKLSEKKYPYLLPPELSDKATLQGRGSVIHGHQSKNALRGQRSETITLLDEFAEIDEVGNDVIPKIVSRLRGPKDEMA